MFCTNCGKNNPAGYKFCQQCGTKGNATAPISVEPAAMQKEQSSSKPAVWALSIIAFLVVAVIFYGVATTDDNAVAALQSNTTTPVVHETAAPVEKPIKAGWTSYTPVSGKFTVNMPETPQYDKFDNYDQYMLELDGGNTAYFVAVYDTPEMDDVDGSLALFLDAFREGVGTTAQIYHKQLTYYNSYRTMSFVVTTDNNEVFSGNIIYDAKNDTTYAVVYGAYESNIDKDSFKEFITSFEIN